MKNAFIMLGIILILLVGGQAFLSYKQSQNQSQSAYNSLGGDFELKGSQDKTLSLKSFEGKPVIMYLGFTHCPDICPTAMGTLEKVLEKLKTKVKPRIQALFVSVDYKRDSPSTVDDYIKYYIKDGVGATGTKEQIDSLVKSYAAYYKFNTDSDSSLGYTVDHTSRFYIISNEGVLLDSVSDTETIDFIAQKVESTLKR